MDFEAIAAAARRLLDIADNSDISLMVMGTGALRVSFASAGALEAIQEAGGAPGDWYAEGVQRDWRVVIDGVTFVAFERTDV